MKRKFFILLISFIVIITISPLAFSSIEWHILQKIHLDTQPLDMAVSLDDKWIFILNEKGEILVYSKNGELNEIINVGKHVNQINVGPIDNLLFLNSLKNKTIEVVEFDFIQKINVMGSPSKGPVEAPVVIALFTDFQ